jgi:hypothetical protein
MVSGGAGWLALGWLAHGGWRVVVGAWWLAQGGWRVVVGAWWLPAWCWLARGWQDDWQTREREIGVGSVRGWRWGD